MNHDLHSALKSSLIAEASVKWAAFKHIRLQHAKTEFTETLHVKPHSFTTAGMQFTDFLYYLGFRRSPCSYFGGECYAMGGLAAPDLSALANSMSSSFDQFRMGAGLLEKCGIDISQPEGWGYYYSEPSKPARALFSKALGNGHVASSCELMQSSEDDYFNFYFTFISGTGDKGWTTHYRSKHMPLSSEFQAAMAFLGGFKWFNDCPECDFEGCWWRFTPFINDGSPINQNTEFAHAAFKAHAGNFSAGIRCLLNSHSTISQYGLSFLHISDAGVNADTDMPNERKIVYSSSNKRAGNYKYDVAMSFAGTERPHAEALATLVKRAGFEPFYDEFYPDQLWGQDLVAFFDRVYRKESRYCVVFISKEYAERMWTTHERTSALARRIADSHAYILPVKVDETDIDGLPPTIAYLSLKEHSIESIATILVNKLKADRNIDT